MPTMNTSDPTEVTLLLAIHGPGTEAHGSLVGSARLRKPEVEELLRQADVFRAAGTLEPRLHQMIYFNPDFEPEFFESDTKVDGISVEDAEKINEIFADEDNYPTNGIQEVEPGKVPVGGNVWLEWCKLVVTGFMGYGRPGQVDFNWVACIKHASQEIETAQVTEEVVRALLPRLS